MCFVSLEISLKLQSILLTSTTLAFIFCCTSLDRPNLYNFTLSNVVQSFYIILGLPETCNGQLKVKNC